MISLSPNEVERRFNDLGISNRFTDQEKTDLTLISTTDGVDTRPDIIAFPTPKANIGLNLLNLRRLCGTDPSHQPSFFDHPWYLDEAFGLEDCTPGWHYIYTDVLAESISQPIDYISSLRSGGLELPSCVEVTLMLFLHYAGTRQQLLHKKHTWCRDLASNKRCVTVGAFGRNGLFVSGHPKDFTSRGLGICARLMR
jgi:hypothetical protein